MQNYCVKDLSIKLYKGAKISESELIKMKKALNENKRSIIYWEKQTI